VLVRLEVLLDRMARRFTVSEADVSSPRGAIDWRRYACERLPVARVGEVLCRYPDLREDEELRAAVHHVLQHHRAALSAQRGAGVVVLALIATRERLIARVAGAAPLDFDPIPGPYSPWHRETAMVVPRRTCRWQRFVVVGLLVAWTSLSPRGAAADIWAQTAVRLYHGDELLPLETNPTIYNRARRYQQLSSATSCSRSRNHGPGHRRDGPTQACT